MNRSDIAVIVAAQVGISADQANEAIKAMCDGITQALARHERVEIRGFGGFRVKRWKERSARNPFTGVGYRIPPEYFILFKSYNGLKRLDEPSRDDEEKNSA